MKREFNLLRDIIRDYTPEEYDYEPEDGEPRAKKGDYALVSVLPVSDPNSATMAQKVVQYQAAIQLAETAPQIYDLPFLHRQMLEVLGINNANKIVPIEDDIQMMDPVSENMGLLNGKPVKAYIAQDHDAHIAVHSSLMQDPKTAATLGQNPQAQATMAAIQAHIVSHFAFAYRKQIEEQAGVPYPAPAEEMDEQTEVLVSRLAAAAGQQVLQQNQAHMAQQQAMQAAQDPLVQLQQQEIQIKKQEADIKAKKLLLDGAVAKEKSDLEKQKIASKEKIEGMKLGVKVGGEKFTHDASTGTQKEQMGLEKFKHGGQIDAEHERTGFQTAADHHKHRTQLSHDMEKHRLQMAHDAEKHRLQLEQQAKTKQDQQKQQSKPKKETTK